MFNASTRQHFPISDSPRLTHSSTPPFFHSLFSLALSKPTTPSFRGNSYLILPPPRIPMKDKRRGPSLYVRPREAIQISLNFSTIEPDGLLLWSEHDQSKFLGLGLENGHLKLASNLLGSNNDTVQAPASGFVADGAWHGTSVLLDRTRLELQLDGEVIFTERLPELNRRTTTWSSTTTTTVPTSTSMQRRGSKEPTISYEDVFYLGKMHHCDVTYRRAVQRRSPFDFDYISALLHLPHINYNAIADLPLLLINTASYFWFLLYVFCCLSILPLHRQAQLDLCTRI